MKTTQLLPNASSLTDDELMTFRIHIDAELSKRGLLFNVGALGEKLSIAYFNSTAKLPNLMQAPTGAKNVDALSRQGDRYSIKAFMKAKKTGTIYPDENNMDKQLFEYLVVVHLNKSYKLEAIYRFTWNEFVKSERGIKE